MSNSPNTTIGGVSYSLVGKLYQFFVSTVNTARYVLGAINGTFSRFFE